MAAFGARYALRTLRVIEKQTAALIESQRPKIAVTAHDDPFQMLCGPSPHRVEIDLDNKGLGVARNLTYETWIELLPLPFVDFTSGADHFASTDPMVLYPNHEPLTINIPIRDSRHGNWTICGTSEFARVFASWFITTMPSVRIER